MVDSQWFRHYFAEPYGTVYADYLVPPEMTRREAEMVRRILGPHPACRILDCPCGYGRHGALLNQHYPRFFGLDLSLDCLQRCQKGNSAHPLVRGDMRCLPFADCSFDAILHLFNSFGYFSPSENLRVLREFQRILASRGTLLLEVTNLRPFIEALKYSPRTCQQIHNVKITEDWAYSRRTRRVTNHTRIQMPGTDVRRSYSVRLYSLPEMEALFRQAGLEIREVMGDTEGSPYVADESGQMILVGRKC